MKRLYRSKTNKVVFGILGGLGDYFGIDPVIVRLIFVLILFATGIVPLGIGYLVAYFIVPHQPLTHIHEG